MNIVFLTLVNIRDIQSHGIYEDLVREFLKAEHSVDIVCPDEGSGETVFDAADGKCRLLRVATGNIQKTGIIAKGIETILVEYRFLNAIKHFSQDRKYDLILYSTPPITICGPIEYLKKRDCAKTYMLLKDIFPQNAVDLGMMSKLGMKAPLFRYFRRKEKQLYALSDHIGCMSQANVDYVLRHNPEIQPSKVEICPNSIEVQDYRLTDEEKLAMRRKYGIPTDRKIFVYGGNLGKPQGIPFVIDCLRAERDNDKAFFLIVGDGTEYGKLEAFINAENPANVMLMKRIPKEDYDRMIAACDVGLIFLDHRFTIPNFPSRLLSYMQAGLPVLACTDPNTDIGKVIVEGGFGWWCESDDVGGFAESVEAIVNGNCCEKGKRGTKYLSDNYSVEKTYRIIMKNN